MKLKLCIEQRFPLGRFHATRWKQGLFGDPYGEWPPSPYRLLRALAMRWFQYAREQGWDAAKEETERKARLYPLLKALASKPPSFFLPPSAVRLLAYKQYQPTGIEWTDKDRTKPAYKSPARTLVPDYCWALPPDEAVIWFWEDASLSADQLGLLDELLARIVYFGRAESFCRLRRLDRCDVQPNCSLSEQSSDDSVPVLAPCEGEFKVENLLIATGDERMANAPFPEGTRWFYARLPQPPKTKPSPPAPRLKYPSGLRCLQFAVGARVFPPMREWVRVAERFRGRVIRYLAQHIEPSSEGKYDKLSEGARSRLELMTGKDRAGKPLEGHQHAYFLLWPDANGVPSRLVVYRSIPFSEEEIAALLRASEEPIRWDFAAPQWLLRLAPMPFDVPPPKGLLDRSKVWRSATPFVVPADRHRFRKNGRERLSETPERVVAKLLAAHNLPQPSAVHREERVAWVYLHETRERRRMRLATGTPWMRPGYFLTLCFDDEVAGPIILGDSAHFGIGLFVPAE